MNKIIYQADQEDDLVLVIPMYGDNFILAKTACRSNNDSFLEFPIDFIKKNESLKNTACKILKQKINLIPQNLELLGEISFKLNSKIQIINVFFATKFTKSKQKLDKKETIFDDVDLINFNKFQLMISNNFIKSGPTLAAFSMFLSKK